MENRRLRITSNLLWRLFERCGAQGVTLIVSIILARLLDPSVYGKIALVTLITSLLQVFVDSGMGNALIQKKNADDVDFSSVLYFNIAVCIVLYFGLFLLTPVITGFYEMPELNPVIRVAGLVLVISGVKNVQQAYVSKHLLFKKFFFATLGGTLGAAVIGITFAVLGFGIWALVAQMLFNSLVDTLILWITVKWRPKKVFSLKRLKGLFSYGWKLLVAALLDNVYNSLSQLIIGKKYTSSDLAFFNKGKQFPKLISTNINTTIDSVLLPVMAEEQNNTARVKAMTRRAITISTYIIAPLMVGLAVCADSLISIVLTDKWLPCALYLRIFCFSFAFYPIHSSNLNAIKALGRSDLFLKLEIAKKAIGLFAVLTTMWISVEAMAYSVLVTSVLSQIINSWPNKKLMSYSYLEQLKDILPTLILSITMGAIVSLIPLVGLDRIVNLIIQVILGVIIYVVGSRVAHLEGFEYIISTFKIMTQKRDITEKQ